MEVQLRSIIDLSHWTDGLSMVIRLGTSLASQDARSLLHYILRLLDVRGTATVDGLRPTLQCARALRLNSRREERKIGHRPHCALSMRRRGGVSAAELFHERERRGRARNMKFVRVISKLVLYT